MKKTTEMVKEFHSVFNHPIGSLHSLEPLTTRQLRIKLLFEELAELAEAGDVRETYYALCHAYSVDHIAKSVFEEQNISLRQKSIRRIKIKNVYFSIRR